MTQHSKDYRWRVLAHSQMGASHVRQQLPNQDQCKYWANDETEGSLPIVLAIADGHGSPKSFRSDVGAAIAVEVAVEAGREFLAGISGKAASVVKNAAEQQIPLSIVREWRARVQSDYQQRPFTDLELDRVKQALGPTAIQRAVEDGKQFIAYGSTLLVVLLDREYLLCFQLGDGEILGLSDVSGDVEYLIPKDETLIANETTSLCQEDALKLFRYRFFHLQDHPPKLILATTDGYANSFASPADFLKVGTDYYNMLSQEGVEAIKTCLPEWLSEASRDGSGDDVTLGIIFRAEAFDCGQSAEQSDVRQAGNDGSSNASPSMQHFSSIETPCKPNEASITRRALDSPNSSERLVIKEIENI